MISFGGMWFKQLQNMINIEQKLVDGGFDGSEAGVKKKKSPP